MRFAIKEHILPAVGRFGARGLLVAALVTVLVHISRPGLRASVDGTGQDLPGRADGPLAQASFNSPAGIIFDSTTNSLFVVDSQNNLIRRVALP